MRGQCECGAYVNLMNGTSYSEYGGELHNCDKYKSQMITIQEMHNVLEIDKRIMVALVSGLLYCSMREATSLVEDALQLVDL